MLLLAPFGRSAATRISISSMYWTCITPPLVTKAVEGNDTRPLTGVEQQELAKHYFKIPYIGHFSGVAQQRERKLINPFCKLIEIKFVYPTFKIKNFFNVKDPFSDRLRVRIVYQFS